MKKVHYTATKWFTLTRTTVTTSAVDGEYRSAGYAQCGAADNTTSDARQVTCLSCRKAIMEAWKKADEEEEGR